MAPAASRRKKSKRSILLQLHEEAKTDKGGPASLADCHLLGERSILQLRLLLAVVKQWRGPKEEGTVQFMCQDAQLRYREVVSSKGGDKVDVKGGRRLSQCPGVRMAEWPSPFNPSRTVLLLVPHIYFGVRLLMMSVRMIPLLLTLVAGVQLQPDLRHGEGFFTTSTNILFFIHLKSTLDIFTELEDGIVEMYSE